MYVPSLTVGDRAGNADGTAGRSSVPAFLPAKPEGPRPGMWCKKHDHVIQQNQQAFITVDVSIAAPAYVHGGSTRR